MTGNIQNISSNAAENITHLQKTGGMTQLIVNDKPFLVFGGELHNSSSSSLEYMKPIWAKLTATHLNTALAAVSWEQIELVESRFNFAVVDGLIEEAKTNNLRLVLLWFGSWKTATRAIRRCGSRLTKNDFPACEIKTVNRSKLFRRSAKITANPMQKVRLGNFILEFNLRRKPPQS